jgi:hypothetical protein
MSRDGSLRVATLCLVGLVLGGLTLAAPESWTLVRRESAMAYHLDRLSVRMQGTYLTYWVLVTFTYDPKFDSALPYKSARLLVYANCATREQDTKSILQYHTPMGKGEPIWAQTFDEATMRMESVEPGTVSAQVLDMACSLKM